MATSKRKKSKKRSVSSSATRARTSAPKTPSAPETAVTPAVVPEEPNIDYEHEYSYVSKDLRQLTIVSLSLFAIMLVVGFFL